jgi:GT2 family glycosyltransferase
VRISVIIPAYNDLPGVMACLNSLQTFQTIPDVEYLVQDDCSTTYHAGACIPNAHVAINAQNVGFAANCNAGAARASGEVLFFVNQDVYGVHGWANGWDAALLRAFAGERVGIVGARLLFPNGTIQSAGGGFDARCQPYHPFIGYTNPHYWETAQAHDCEWVTGAALAIRRDVWQQVGGFDEGYTRGYFEDVDLCLKVREAGYRVRYEPDVTLIHKAGGSGGSAYFMQNALRFRQTWVDTGKVKPDTSAVHVRYW